MTGFHHVAFGCRDLHETVKFYEAIGFPLVHTEVNGRVIDGVEHFLRHVFFDLGNGSSLAFFDLHGVGEEPSWTTDLAEGTKTPKWVNHVAFRATEERQQDARARMDSLGVKPFMEADHGWCQSIYYLDPNGIMIEFCRDTPGFVPDRDAALKLLDLIPS
jgi:catechol 2,3-dioxygenase-like lactoylglutathione lyase family enzyme